MTGDIDFSEEMFLVTRETAEAYLKGKARVTPAAPAADSASSSSPQINKSGSPEPASLPPVQSKPAEQLTLASMAWTGEVPPQKWMKFYTAVLSKFAASKGLRLKVSVEVTPEGDISKQKLEETKVALRELGMSDEIASG